MKIKRKIIEEIIRDEVTEQYGDLMVHFRQRDGLIKSVDHSLMMFMSRANTEIEALKAQVAKLQVQLEEKAK